MNLKKVELKLKILKKYIDEKRVMYDHNVDQKGYKWSGKSILKKLKLNNFLNMLIQI